MSLKGLRVKKACGFRIFLFRAARKSLGKFGDLASMCAGAGVPSSASPEKQR